MRKKIENLSSHLSSNFQFTSRHVTLTSSHDCKTNHFASWKERERLWNEQKLKTHVLGVRAKLLHSVAKYANLWRSSCVLKHLKDVKSPNLKSCVSRFNFTFFPTFLICSCQFNSYTVNAHFRCRTTWNKSCRMSLFFGVASLRHLHCASPIYLFLPNVELRLCNIVSLLVIVFWGKTMVLSDRIILNW